MEQQSLKDEPAGVLRIAVTIPTFRRPGLLENLLRKIEPQVLHCRQLSDRQIEASVIVIDNDAEQREGLKVVQHLADQMGYKLVGLLEHATGVSRVRNRMIAEALALGAEFIQMIDDDEYPGPGWLEGMLRCAIEHEADIVSAPVRPDYASPPPRWVQAHYLFDDQPNQTGAFPAVQRTGNTLFRSTLFGKRGLFTDGEWFAIELGHIGGEDSHLVEKLVKHGARHVWCEEAEVFERIPAERLQYTYLAARAYRSGNCGMVYRSLLNPSPVSSALRVGKTGFLFLRWLLLSYRYLIPGRAPLHHLELHTVRGRIHAHLGNVKGHYGNAA